MNAYKSIATRITNAETSFIDTLRITVPALTEDEGQKALNAFIKTKLVTLDPVIGRYNATTGQIFDAAVIRRAIDYK